MSNAVNEQQSTNNNQQSTVIVANGKFPEYEIPLNAIKEAGTVVCCDGAIEKLDKYGFVPTSIVGDLDSLPFIYRERFADKLFHDPDQETNDLTKAVKWCIGNGIKNVSIVGATGLREDHTMGNIGLLPLYSRMGVEVDMLTDNGRLLPLLKSASVNSFKGQQVSIFSPNCSTRISTRNLKYPIENRPIEEFWMGTLNESLGDQFELVFEPGPLILFLSYTTTKQ